MAPPLHQVPLDERVAHATADATLGQRDALVPGPLHIKSWGEVSIVAPCQITKYARLTHGHGAPFGGALRGR